MDIQKTACFDHKTQTILGPYSKLFVILARGLFSKWKQPIFYSFDFYLSKEFYSDLIVKLANYNMIVVGTTCDLGATNRKFLNEMQISPEHSFWTHPQLNTPIFFFADIPHMLKLMRNHFLDTGFVLENGTTVTKEALFHLIQKEDTDLKCCFKLTLGHLTVFGVERQRVRLAAQLFSSTVANSLKEFYPKLEELANFIQKIDNFFDVFNSRSENDCRKFLKSGYGIYTAEQNLALDTMYHLCSTMRSITKTGKRKALLPFQIGIMESIHSLKSLFHYLQEKYNINYILTFKLHQDALENLFSQIRGLGHQYDNPNPIEVKNRLRILMISKNVHELFNCKNVENNSDEENLSVKLCQHLTSRFEKIINQPLTILAELPINLKALAYLGGYIAFKFRNKHGFYNLGMPTNIMNAESPEIPTEYSWIFRVSKGKLLTPTPLFWEYLQKMEAEFLNFHGIRGFYRGTYAVTKLVEEIRRKYPYIPEAVAKFFSRIRLFIRIKTLNSKLREKRMMKKIRKFY